MVTPELLLTFDTLAYTLKLDLVDTETEKAFTETCAFSSVLDELKVKLVCPVCTCTV